jgi:lysine/ornithine N-monooxygenase
MAEEWASSRWYANHDPTVSGESKVAFLAGYQAAAPQWISVKDRLPEEDVDVAIGWFSKTASNKTFWTTDAAQLTNKVFSGWREYPEATHWMPLPAAPEEE